MIMLLGIVIMIFPEPNVKQAAPLTNTQIPENPENPSIPEPSRIEQTEKVNQVSIQHNIEKSLTKHALNFTQIKQGIYNLQLSVDEQFSWGSAIMSHALQSKLTYIARALIDQPQAVIHITGHSDPTGSQERNIILSKLRAKVVANFLVLQGIPQHRLTTNGRGSSEPVSTDNPPVNRRVDLLIETMIPISAS